MSYLINIAGLGLILLTLWWFWLSKTPMVSFSPLKHYIDIHIKDGIYFPAQICVSSHQPIILRFFREDPSPAASVIVFSELKRRYILPLRKTIEIKLEPQPEGRLEFTSEAGMMRGTLIIE